MHFRYISKRGKYEDFNEESLGFTKNQEIQHDTIQVQHLEH